MFENGIPNIDMVNEWVLQCGAEHGYENVRGGSFTLWDSERHLGLIQSFLRKKETISPLLALVCAVNS